MAQRRINLTRPCAMLRCRTSALQSAQFIAKGGSPFVIFIYESKVQLDFELLAGLVARFVTGDFFRVLGRRSLRRVRGFIRDLPGDAVQAPEGRFEKLLKILVALRAAEQSGAHKLPKH